MNILILGSGGREHTLAYKISQSKLLNKLFVAPGNAGTKNLGTNINTNITDFEDIKQVLLKYHINMVIVGPEVPLVQGFHDFVLADSEINHIKVIGPQMAAAQLEGSKEFAKEFMMRHQIPTAQYQSFTAKSLSNGYAFLESLNQPYVLKADGLAAGKGVVILNDLTEAKTELKAMLTDKKFGDASTKVVIEEFLDGIEMSCFVLTDGKSYINLPNAKDYKRIGKGDKGLNTGGMGAISPVPFADKDYLSKIEERIIKPTVKGLQQDSLPYVGFIFFGLIKVGDNPFVIEYNVRMGDPETEVVFPRIKSDVLALFKATANQKLDEFSLEIDSQSAATVMLVSGGYPETYEKDKPITGLNQVTNSIVFHAGTKSHNNQILTNGGRVLAVTSFGSGFKDALKKSYRNIKKIYFEKMNYRTDIGFDL